MSGSGDTDGTDGGDALSRDDLFEVLSNRRRRHVIHFLRQREDGRAELSEVVERIAAWENGTDVDQLSYDDRKSVHISLYQHHAPKMDEVGVIDYDKRAGVLTLTDGAADLDVYLDDSPDPAIPWELYFTALSGVAVVAVMLGATTPLPGIAVGVLVSVAFLISSVVFFYDVRYRRSGGGGPPPEVDEKDR